MKKTMKFFAALTIMMGFTVSAMGQAVITQTITANATVQTKLVITEEQPLNFGTVDNVVGQTLTVSLLGAATQSGGATIAQTGVTEGVAKIVRTGAVLYKLTVLPKELKKEGSKLPIGAYTTSYSLGTKTAAQAGTATAVTTATTTSVPDGTSDIYVHIGATVTPNADTNLTGVHTAAITLSAEYN